MLLEGASVEFVFPAGDDQGSHSVADHVDDGWTGLDLGSQKIISRIKFAPRPGKDLFQKRMIGGRFQGSNIADFSSGVVDLYVVRDTPPVDVLTDKPAAVSTPVRFVRYLTSETGAGNVAEIEFWGRDAGTVAAPSVPSALNKPPDTKAATTGPTGVKQNTTKPTNVAASPPTATPSPANSIALRVILGGDDQLGGVLIDWSEKRLRIATPFGADGGLDIPVESLRAVWKGTPDQVKQAKALPLDPGPEDAAFVTKENAVVVVRGVALGIAGDSLRFKFNDEERKINLAKVVGVLLGGTDAKRDPSLRQTVQLTGGDSISGTWQKFDPATATLGLQTPWGASLDIPFNTIARVTSVNGRLAYLTDMKPAAVEQTPYFDRMLPYQINRSLTGGAMKLADGETKIGISVHSRTVLTYDAGGQFEDFKVKVGFQQPEGKLGRAVIRVLGDGKTLFEDLDARGDAPKPADLNLKIAGVKMLILEVDFGADEDTGDRVVWANPRLLKAKK